ncbi:asparagine synthase-related protein [Chromatiaceae bacterium AAb-1]|nr:asparagine synthase-related protein [Chromatiaceae bacterium AAb-1]
MDKVTFVFSKVTAEAELLIETAASGMQRYSLHNNLLHISETSMRDVPVLPQTEQVICCYDDANSQYTLLIGHARPYTSDAASEHLVNSAVLARLTEQGAACYLPQLSGRFALLEFNCHTGAVLAATDRFASLALYYSDDPQQLIISTDLNSVAALLPETDIAPQALLDYLYFHNISGPASIYKQIQKLPLASQLQWQHSLSVSKWWQPVFKTDKAASKVALAAKLQQSLLDAVRPYSEQDDIGTFLSGGLDSSTVTACLAKLNRKPVKTFTIGFSEPGYDETAYARIIADAFGTEHHVYYVSQDDIVSALPEIAAYFYEPFGNSSALPTYFCARLAKEQGVRMLLAGDGGDELFSGNERYARQMIFERFLRYPALFRELLTFAVNSGNRLFKNGLLQKGQSFLEQTRMDLATRLQYYNFLHRTAAAEVFTDNFLQQVDSAAPLQKIQQRFAEVATADPVNAMLYNDWKFTLADNDLVKVNTMTAFAGVGVAYPMLDQAVVELANQVPARMKLEGNQLRAFYKYACSSLLPQATIRKTKHGFGLPFGRWLTEHKPLQQLAYQQLQALKQRNIFRESFIDNAITQHQTGHAAYYGELIWLLTMLELWLQAHAKTWQMN